MVGTPGGHAMVPGLLIVGVIDATAPAGAAAVAVVLLVSDAPVRFVVLPVAELPTEVTAWVCVITPLNELIVVPLMVGTPTGHAMTGGVHAEPVNDGAELVPVGVMVSDPPVPPTFPFAASVPRMTLPFRAVTSANPSGQVPVSTHMIAPVGIATGMDNGVHDRPSAEQRQNCTVPVPYVIVPDSAGHGVDGCACATCGRHRIAAVSRMTRISTA